MPETKTQWLDLILQANEQFRMQITPEKLPVQRVPGPLVITCMDPRVNLEAIGIPGFTNQGEGASSVRIVRTIGGMAEPRSLLIGIFLAGIREVVVLMHTDCVCSLAYSKIDLIIENMGKMLAPIQIQTFKETIGEPFRERLMEWLKVFESPAEALRKEIASIKALPFVPENIVIHGLLYDLASGDIKVVVNGYEQGWNGRELSR